MIQTFFSPYNFLQVRGEEIDQLDSLIFWPLDNKEKLMKDLSGRTYRVYTPSVENSYLFHLIYRIRIYLNTGDHLSAISELMEKFQERIDIKVYLTVKHLDLEILRIFEMFEHHQFQIYLATDEGRFQKNLFSIKILSLKALISGNAELFLEIAKDFTNTLCEKAQFITSQAHFVLKDDKKYKELSKTIKECLHATDYFSKAFVKIVKYQNVDKYLLTKYYHLALSQFKSGINWLQYVVEFSDSTDWREELNAMACKIDDFIEIQTKSWGQGI